MTIKQTGGIFGRNVSFTDVTTDEVTANKVNISTVGGMGLFSGSLLYAGAGDTTLLFSSGGDAILPRGSAGAARDNAVDLGNATNRWKDIYLAGNVVVRSGQGIDFSATAGTGTSELFDDYEEGTFTPTYVTTGTDFGSVTYDTQDGHYTKVGNMVNARLYLRTDAITVGSASGTVRIGGLPFAAANSRNSSAVWSAAFTGDHPHIAQASGSELVLYYQTTSNGSSNNALAIADLNTGANDNTVIISICYQSS